MADQNQLPKFNPLLPAEPEQKLPEVEDLSALVPDITKAMEPVQTETPKRGYVCPSCGQEDCPSTIMGRLFGW